MVNAAANYPCVYNSATGTLTIRGLGTINFSALLEEVKETADKLNPGERIVLEPGHLRTGGIASEFPSTFNHQEAERNMALGRILWEKLLTRFSEENCTI